jgi:energy-converting hydrogenase Eha subunit A
MFVPEEGLLLWPFLMVDAVIMGYLVAPKGRQAIGASPDRWVRLSLLPAPMFALGLYALLAPILGMFIALAAGVSVVIIGWRNSHSKIQISNSR